MNHYTTPRSLTVVVMLCAACSANTPSKPNETTKPEARASKSVVTRCQALRAASMQVTSSEVTFDAAGVTVHGTITAPKQPGRYPAVLLIAGSGPTDRDWRSPLLPGDNGSAKLLAEGLTARGVVVLRYDKRASGETAAPESLTWDDYTAEQNAGLAALATREDVAKEAIFAAGHSEGGAHALRLATRATTPLAGIVLMATSGRTLRDVLVWQIHNQLLSAGIPEMQVAAHDDQLGGVLDQFIGGASVEPTAASDYPGVQNVVRAFTAPMAVSFARELLGFEPVKAIKEVDVPIFVLHGAKDIQVDSTRDAEPLRDAAKAAGKDVRFTIYEDADHVFKSEPRPVEELGPQAGLAYNAPGRELADGVVADLSAWIDAHGPSPCPPEP
ncbi:MAG: alpha/beta fold hydrolase [Myxococcota bacterium]